jgi:outer membrane protein TolC
MYRYHYHLAALLLLFGTCVLHAQQTLTLKEALDQSLTNYEAIKSKSYRAEASEASLSQARREYLPNLVVAAQQDYGTINGQNGPLYGFGGYGVASSGLPLNQQNWNAAFGALYLANFNWEVFSFGRTRQRIKIAEASLQEGKNDLSQEKFQHQIRVASAYLNLLASQRLTRAQQKNLQRAQVFKNSVTARAMNGLVAGVDSSLANAEVSNAKIAFIKAKDFEQEQSNRLCFLMGIPTTVLTLDSAYVNRIPDLANDTITQVKQHPTLKYFQSRLNVSEAQSRWINRSYFPTFSLFAIFQQRGSGFKSAYTQDQTAYTQDYASGITPSRGNYLLGAGLVWNLTTILRSNSQLRAQRFITQSLQSDYALADQQLQAQRTLADTKLANALETYNEAPIQVRSATDAYNQKSTLYKNGLTTIVEVTQTLYVLNRAEVDRDIAYVNVWQALLLKAAATGDIELIKN